MRVLNFLAAAPALFERAAPTVSKRRVFHDQSGGGNGTLGPEDYDMVAKELGVRPRVIKAISIIESAEKALTDGGKPVVRFEASYWRRNRLATREGKYFDKAENSTDLDERWTQFEIMHQVDPLAAVLSHSFGWPQIMGFNHYACGFQDPEGFLQSMMNPEGQAKNLSRFVRNSGRLWHAMKVEDVKQIALHYNGKNYRRNRYDTKLERLGVGQVHV